MWGIREGGCSTIGTAPARRFEQTRARLSRRVSSVGFALPGSITARITRCGKPTCRCVADPPELHGPYMQWSRTVDGKTVTRLLTDVQARRYQRWIDNARKLRALVRELEALGVTAAEHAEGWS